MARATRTLGTQIILWIFRDNSVQCCTETNLVIFSNKGKYNKYNNSKFSLLIEQNNCKLILCCGERPTRGKNTFKG